MEYQYIHEAMHPDGATYLVARKVTGDVNVPLGKVTWKLNEIPALDKVQKEGISGHLQIRMDTTDPNGFQWDSNVSLVEATENQIKLRWRWWDMRYDRVQIDGYPQNQETVKPPISSTK